MDRPSYAVMCERLHGARLEELPPLRIAVLRNIVVEPIEPYLQYFALEMGFNGQCGFGQYDNVFQEAVGGCPALLNDSTDCVVVFLKLDTLAWELVRRPLSLSAAQIAAEKSRIEDFVGAVLDGIRAQTPALILWHAFERPLYPALGVLDYQARDGQSATVQALNEFLRERLRQEPAAFLVDLNVCMARIGARAFYDPRYWHIGRAPFSREGLGEIAHEIFRYLRPLKGKSKKCVALDCDGVLWGGILGEDGFDGIKLGPTYPGSMYYELQHELVNLHERGVLLALCSRNNADEVWDVFDRHPGMVLRREHISAAQINWQDKATNVRQLAADLNIGLDAFIFLDDSEFEVNLIRQVLPEVQAIHLPKERAVEYRDIVLASGWCESLTWSSEDRNRTTMYRAEQARQSLRASTSDLESYYRSLEMVLELRLADAFSLPRIAQLTQKTNQFNLTTRRYSEAEIRHLSDQADADVITVRLSDRFGDAGLVGVCILRYAQREAFMETLLLSCRVLGRGVEDAVLSQCVKRARARGCRVVVGEYRPTPKNGQVAEFYPRHGFTSLAEDGESRRFSLDLAARLPDEPVFFARIDSTLASASGNSTVGALKELEG